MKIHSISTDMGPAILVEILAEIEIPIHSIEAPEGWGAVFWGRCDRATFGELLLSSKADWIADYSPKLERAVVLWPKNVAGKEMIIDTSCVDAVCPHCGGSKYISNGSAWICRVPGCEKQWRKVRSNKPKGRPKREVDLD